MAACRNSASWLPPFYWFRQDPAPVGGWLAPAGPGAAMVRVARALWRARDPAAFDG